MSAARVPNQPTQPTEPVVRLVTSPSEEDLGKELTWYFAEAETAYGLQSNYDAYVERALSGRVGMRVKSADTSVDERMGAAVAAGTIRRYLRAMPNREAGILACAFGARDWPLELEEELGPLTGIVVRLAVAGRRKRLPEGNLERHEAEMATSLRKALLKEGPLTLDRLRGQAAGLLACALRAYAVVREPGETLVPGG
jgi:hypothetical protein